MHARDAVFLEDLCPKLRLRRWRQTLHRVTNQRCLYCGHASESIDHVLPQSRGGLSVTENCVPACLACNGDKGDADAFSWYRRQSFYDPRRAMALKAWVEGDLKLAMRLLQWAEPKAAAGSKSVAGQKTAATQQPVNESQPWAEPKRWAEPKTPSPATAPSPHQTRQATGPLWRWQMAA